jgi:D-amino-acid dehydrogenase
MLRSSMGRSRALSTVGGGARKMAVIGAGVTGVTTARALMARGYDVTVFDRHRYAAMETSFANGGQLSASNAEVWNSWGTVLKGLKWMLKKDAPLLMNPFADMSWQKYSWMAEFLAQIPNYKSNTVETVRLAIKARELLLQHAETYNFDFNPEHRGILHFYDNDYDYSAAKNVSKLYAEGGLERKDVTAEEMSVIEPSLGGGKLDGYVGGCFTPSDFTGDIHRYTVGLAEGIEKEGVKFKQGTDVKLQHNPQGGVDVMHASWSGGFQSTGGESPLTKSADPDGYASEINQENFDGVVICAGVRSRDLAAQLGDRVNIYPVKGYSITVNLDDERSQKAAPWVSLLDDKTKIVTSRLGVDRLCAPALTRIPTMPHPDGPHPAPLTYPLSVASFVRRRPLADPPLRPLLTDRRSRVAGTAEFNGYNRDIRQDRVDPLIKWCNLHFPEMSTESVVPWSGLRPMMPSMLPRIGAGAAPGVFYNTGHGHLGWTLSAATAELVAEEALMQDRKGYTGKTFAFSCNEKMFAPATATA